MAVLACACKALSVGRKGDRSLTARLSRGIIAFWRPSDLRG
jgi:hypothetical protein